MPVATPRGRRRLGVVTAGLLALVLSVTPSLASWADEYDDQAYVSAQIASQSGAVDEANAALVRAAAEADNAHAAWQAAKNTLAGAQAAQAAAAAERDRAQAADAARAAELAQAQEALAKARDAVAKAKDEVEVERKNIGDIGRSVVQQDAPLAGVSAMLTAKTTAELGQIEQWNGQMMEVHAKAMERLQTKLAQLKADEAAQAKAEADAQSAKQAAAKALADKQAAEQAASQAAAQAAGAEQAVAAAAAASDAAKANAAQAAEAERARMSSLEAERANVEQRIRDRLAREEAARQEAARAAAAAEAARIAAQQAANDAAAQAAADAAAAAAAAAQAAVPAPVYNSGSGSPFIAPVNGPMTSPFGMRLHPVIGIWVLHDGTDYGVGCGAPIRAAASGTVVERYWDTTGFGNRLIIDHGRWNGTALTTGYNHAQSYIVSPGQWVERGQIVGYVGSTGYSTGCHLHLNLWVNGVIHDPQDGWF